MYNEKVHILDHPLLQHKLTILRDERTGVKEFREIVSEIAALECYEATRDLPLADIEGKQKERRKWQTGRRPLCRQEASPLHS